MKLCPLHSNPCYKFDCEFWIKGQGCAVIIIAKQTATPQVIHGPFNATATSDASKKLWWRDAT